MSDQSLESIESKAEEDAIALRDLIVAAATGSTDGAPDDDASKLWKGHGRAWFKTNAADVSLPVTCSR